LTKPNSKYLQLSEAVAGANTILILQPDSPDGDSLGSALGLEEIFGELGKQTFMYSYKEPENYLRTQEGWDRVGQDLPKHFDLTILVDTGSPALIKAALEHHHAALTSKPFFIIDHHVSRLDFGFAVTEIVEPGAAAAEVITRICLELGWSINASAASKLATAILSDSLGLTTPDSTAETLDALTHLVRCGANLYDLYTIKRESSALSAELLQLKGQLISSIQFFADGRLAVLEIPPAIVAQYKDVAEPYTLVINDMQWTKDVQLAAVFKNYGTKINVPLRSKSGLAAPIAEQFGGGGHPNAAAYRTKTTDINVEISNLVAAFTAHTEAAS